jgi:hypothetical protein
MKLLKIFLFGFTILCLGYFNIIAEDCSGCECPEEPEGNWTADSTGWVTIQLNDTTTCVGKICYCWDLTYTDGEHPNFYLNKIIWEDSCFAKNYQNIDLVLFKQSLVTEMARNHQNDLPQKFCPNSYFVLELYLSFCFASGYYQGYPVSMLCEGEGNCVQLYKCCWETNPLYLKIEIYGDPTYYQSDCYLPFVVGPGTGWTLIHDCIAFCY